jgi:hypothetical protein
MLLNSLRLKKYMPHLFSLLFLYWDGHGFSMISFMPNRLVCLWSAGIAFLITYAQAGMEIGALELSGQLIQHVYDVWISAKEGFHAEPDFLRILNDHRELAVKITEKQKYAINNLASELRESCYHEKPNFRAEVAAILWTIGFIPETQLLISDCTDQLTKLPKTFFQHIVFHSLKWISSDPLIQNVWLQMKDKPVFNLRDHKSIFAIINSVYPQPPLSVFDDLPGPGPAGKVYAQTLIGFFMGNLKEDEAAGYMELCQYIEIMKIDGNINWLIALRMLGLRDLVAHQFHWTEPNVNFRKELGIWYYLSDMARWGLDQANIHPGLPDCRSRSELPIFQVIEEELVRACDAHNNDGIDKVLQTIEHLHMADLAYWLIIAPPLPSKEEAEILQPLLKEQARLLEYVRGAYFLMMFPMLPLHYRRYSKLMDDIAEDETDQQKELDPATGRKEYQELRDQLDMLFDKMKTIAPRYAERCRSPEASIQVLAQAINSHAQPYP